MVHRLLPLVGLCAALAASPAAAQVTHSGATSTRFAAATAGAVAQGSVEQVAVTGEAPQGPVTLLNARNAVVARARADAVGAHLFRHVPPGAGYSVRSGEQRTGTVTVTSARDVPPRTLYTDQHLGDGFGYVRTRDGTLLSVNVSLPGPASAGPYPTVVEYSGYDPSNPAGTPPVARIAGLFGYATVGVNLRGTGCSGGAYDYFEPLQSLDGYDVIETVAAQPWVAGGKVGMVGISYSGITQLYVAATRPPHLAAIAPLSVIDDTYDTLFPGGILNNGFALSWAQDRQHDAQPAASQWVRKRIAAGDTTCAANQGLRRQSPDLSARIKAVDSDPTTRAALAPDTFVDRIDVPVFIAGSWQDEQTGAHFATMLDDFAPGVPVKATVMNGIHADSLVPELIPAWHDFLDFYVAHRVPTITPQQRLVASAILGAIYQKGASLPPDRFDPAGDYASQLAAYEAEPELRVRFDVGAGDAAGAPIAAFEATYASWPPPATTATTWYLTPGHTLADAAPRRGAPAEYRYDPAALPATVATSPGKGELGAPVFHWQPVPKGDGLAYETDPLAHDTVMLGTGSVDLWLGSTARDVDIEVTITEVRPDGQETYVQSGWLRASRRALDTKTSSALLPDPTFATRDAAPLPRGALALVRVPLYPFGHAFRAGSRVRITVQPPGGNRPAWAFDALTYQRVVTNRVGVSGAHASKVVLPVIAGATVPTPLPACGSLRGQACRPVVEP
ncbi:MAG: CocE/NonD family hydrolase [Acidimicrobiia bacterium]